MVAWRRHLHAWPELSFEEHDTQAFVRDALEQMGLPPRAIAGTGLLVDLRAREASNSSDGSPAPDVDRGPAACIAIRADLDALPISEVAGRAYGSRRPGVMHACGHDVHTACALGAAWLLAQVREWLPLPVRLIFQPGEELLPGGATRVIADGGLLDPDVAAIVGLHVAPDLPVGTLGLREGAYMASADEIYLTLRGPGGHGALPHQSVDLIAVAAQLLVSLQQVVSRKAPADVPSVLTFGKIASEGGATNVLPARLDLAGTFRTYDAAWRARAHTWIRQIAEGTAHMLGAQIELRIVVGYPALSNDAEVTRSVRLTFEQALRESCAGLSPAVDAAQGQEEHSAKARGDLAETDRGVSVAGDGGVGFGESPPASVASSPATGAEVEAATWLNAVVDLSLRPTAEDFAWYLREVPGTFFRLGVANPGRGIVAGVHTSEFDVDEDCLPIGAFALAVAALSLAEQRVASTAAG